MYPVAVNSTWPGWLESLIRVKNLNNKGLAVLLGVSPSTVGDWLKQKYKPDAPMVIRLGELAHENPVDLFGMIYDIGVEDDESANQDAEIKSMLHSILKLPPADRQALREIVETMLRRLDKG